jgi:hypothetical protein
MILLLQELMSSTSRIILLLLDQLTSFTVPYESPLQELMSSTKRIILLDQLGHFPWLNVMTTASNRTNTAAVSADHHQHHVSSFCIIS